MVNLLCTDTELISVADAIRSKKGDSSSTKYGFPTGMVNAIGALNVGTGLSPAASAADIRNGKKAVVNRQTITGTMTEKAAATITPGTSDQEIAANQYLTGKQTIKGDADLVASKIKKGVTIFNVTGTYNSPGLAKDANRTAAKTFTSFLIEPGQCKTVTISLSINDFSLSYTADALVIVPKSINNPLSGYGYSAIKSITYNNNGTISVELLYAMWNTSQVVAYNVNSATITCDIYYIPN